jgi:hypothetical protein
MCVLWVPGLDLLASGGIDGRIKLLDVATGEIKKATFTDRHTDCVRGLAVVPGTTLLASCSDDESVKVWDCITGACVPCRPSPDMKILSGASQWTLLLILSCRSATTRPLRFGPTSRPPVAAAANCVLACLSSLAAKLFAGEEYDAGAVKKPRRAEDEGEDVKGGGGQGDGGRLQGVMAFERITSADVWRYILEFV